jgi:hypothetical protein
MSRSLNYTNLSLATVTASACQGLASPASHHFATFPVGDFWWVLAEDHPVETLPRELPERPS